MKILKIIPFFLILLFSVLIIAPTLHDNIRDPNLIVYFNNDEGYLMDLMWYYYSGEKRESFQLDIDYGLELFYIAKFCRYFLSPFFNFTPTTFVLLLRCLNALGWLLALIALWYFMKRHFKAWWKQSLAVLLLGVRPVLDGLLNNLKPEPLILFILIIGLHFILNFLDNPKKRYIYLSILCASFATIIKPYGFFLWLPFIVALVCISEGKGKKADYKISWGWCRLTLFIIGLIVIVGTLLPIFFYVRISTGHTSYQDLGLWQSLLFLKLPLFLLGVGILFIILSLVVSFLFKIQSSILRFSLSIANKVCFAFLYVAGLSFLTLALMGFGWFIHPQYFLKTYSYFGSEFLMSRSFSFNTENIQWWFFKNIVEKLQSFDWVLMIFFILYIFIEMYSLVKESEKSKSIFLKRITLLSFSFFGLMMVFLPTKMGPHHSLPFTMTFIVLGIEGIAMLTAVPCNRIILNTSRVIIALMLMGDISLNSFLLLRERGRSFSKAEDVVFKINDWFMKNIPFNAKIISDHPTRVYLAKDYKQVKYFPIDSMHHVDQIRSLIESFRPRYVYYSRERTAGGVSLPIKEIVSTKPVRLLKVFRPSSTYVRDVYSRFVVYEILY